MSDVVVIGAGAAGVAAARALHAAALARPLRRTLFFAGEAVETERGTGTVDGAISSGRRAAKQVLRALG